MKKKVLIALLVVAIISVSVMAFAGCDNRVKVGYQSGTTGQFYTDELINIKGMGYTDAALAVENMIAGRIEYVITDIAPAKTIASQDKYKDKVKVIDIPLTDEFYGFAVNKGRDDLRLQLNEFMTNNEQKLKDLQIAYITGVVEPKMIVSGDENAENALIVATAANFPPFEYIEGNFYAGYDLEVMQMFCEAYNYQLVIKNMNFDAIINNVNLGSAHIGAAALTWSEERAKNVNFTVGYYDATQVIICMADDTTFDDCKSREDVEAILNSLKK
ncbi:MAG: transporter substrate-binding domain-containing protein [Clostridiales bacterium]|nr:transporter substrate-binding domain-containing protein [Clostridiales bacterium]